MHRGELRVGGQAFSNGKMTVLKGDAWDNSIDGYQVQGG